MIHITMKEWDIEDAEGNMELIIWKHGHLYDIVDNADTVDVYRTHSLFHFADGTTYMVDADVLLDL